MVLKEFGFPFNSISVSLGVTYITRAIKERVFVIPQAYLHFSVCQFVCVFVCPSIAFVDIVKVFASKYLKRY